MGNRIEVRYILVKYQKKYQKIPKKNSKKMFFEKKNPKKNSKKMFFEKKNPKKNTNFFLIQKKNSKKKFQKKNCHFLS
jgi:hypothetical protein